MLSHSTIVAMLMDGA